LRYAAVLTAFMCGALMLLLSPVVAKAGWFWRDGEWVYVPEGRAQTTQAPQAPKEPAQAKPPEKEPAPAKAPAKEPVKAPPEKPVPQPAKQVKQVVAQAPVVADVTKELRPAQGDGPKFPVSRFVVEYVCETGGLPTIEEIGQIPITLGQTPEGYVPARGGVPTVTTPLGELGGDPAPFFYATALLSLNEQVVAHFNGRGIFGVFVTPRTDDIQQRIKQDALGKPESLELLDKRAQGTTVLRIAIFVGRVGSVRTVASGDRVPQEDRVNNPTHRRILKNSPVQAASAAEGEETQGLLQKDLLDRYALFLSRHPGRRVDVAVARGDDPGQVNLDYMVAESKPWVLFHQVSNTGTEETGEWRERFGFIHNQLTGNDDTLSIDYVTASFNTAHAAVLSYEAPILGLERVRWAVYGTFGKFKATNVAPADERFLGETWSTGGDLFVNFFQDKDLFIDFTAGCRWEDIRVVNQIVELKGRTSLFTPGVGFRAERVNETQAMQGIVKLEWLEEHVGHTDKDDLRRFGRFAPDKDWVVLRWNFFQSFYLEPLLNREEWENPDTPKTSTLAHEVAAYFKGHHSLGSRLIPFAEQTVGGVYSVRGYPESIVAGDATYVASIEYRYHIPRALQPSTSFKEPREPANLFGSPFRFRPQQVYGHTDWDLILKTFFDIGKANNFEKLPRPLEDNYFLMSCGLGMELQVLRNLTVRLDYGVALRGIDAREVDAGDQRLHVVATLSF